MYSNTICLTHEPRINDISDLSVTHINIIFGFNYCDINLLEHFSIVN